MAIRDWSALQWDGAQGFAPQTDYQLARSSLGDAGKGSENKFAANAQNAALLQSLGYGGQGLSYLPDSDYGFGAQPVWSDEARNWLADKGYSLGVAHDPGTSAGGRAEYFGLLDPSGKYALGQSDPTMTQSDTLMDQIAMFAAFLGPAVGGITSAAGGLGAGAGLGGNMAGIAADGVSLGSAGIGGAGAVSAGAGAGLGTGALEGGSSSGALESGGNSLVQNNANTFWDKVQNGALKGGAKGGITSAVQGKNPLSGALTGAIGGAIGGGISSIGDGSLGNAMSLDSTGGGLNIIPGAFGDELVSPTDGIINNLGSFGESVGNTGGDMGWTDWLSGFGSSNGWSPSDLGSFSDPGTFDWGTVDLGGYDGSSSVPGLNLPDIPETSSGLDWNRINDILSQTPTELPELGSMTGGVGSGWWDVVKGAFAPVSDGKGGTKANPMGTGLMALLGGGLGAASGGGTETKTQAPWAAAQPYLTNVLGDADSMRANLAANPFTPQQTQAYQNAYSGLDQARSAMPGLLNWSQQAMQRQSTTPSYEQLFGGQGTQPAQMPAGLLQQQQPTMQAGGPGGLLGNDDRMKALMAKGRGLIG